MTYYSIWDSSLFVNRCRRTNTPPRCSSNFVDGFGVMPLIPAAPRGRTPTANCSEDSHPSLDCLRPERTLSANVFFYSTVRFAQCSPPLRQLPLHQLVRSHKRECWLWTTNQRSG